MEKIYVSAWTFSRREKKNKKIFIANAVIVTGNDVLKLKNDLHYKRRALFGIDIYSNHELYIVEKVEILKQIGTETNY